MDDWLTFEGTIIPMEWGKSVYTVLPIPTGVMETLNRQSARRVDVELNDVPFNMALTKAPALDKTFIYTGKSVLRQADIAPGDVVDVRMKKADPAAVETPADVAHSLSAHGLTSTWVALTPGKRRGHLHRIEIAKRPETRAKRIAALVETVGSGD